jgi:ABC-type Mn2+/Zn2+ transport system permease subunit
MGGLWFLSMLFGLLSVIGGIVASFELDLPLGAAVVGVAGALLLPGALTARLRTA